MKKIYLLSLLALLASCSSTPPPVSVPVEKGANGKTFIDSTKSSTSQAITQAENDRIKDRDDAYRENFGQRQEIIAGMKYHIWYTDNTSTKVGNDGLNVTVVNITKDSLEVIELRKRLKDTTKVK